MYRHLDDFLTAYAYESRNTQRVLAALSQESLGVHKAEGDTSMGELAWHIATAPAWLIRHEGIEIGFSYVPPAGLDADAPPPDLTVGMLVAEQRRVSEALVAGCREKLAEADLSREASWFGSTLPLGLQLNMLINHEVHHRGQLSAMMRRAGLSVPGSYGPNKEEYEEMVRQKAVREAAQQ